MRFLNGKEVAGYIQERQGSQVRRLRQEFKVNPKLAIVTTVDNPVINTYLKLKQRYGSEIEVDVDVHRIKQDDAKNLISKLNEDESVHAIIIQLPIEDPKQTDEIVNLVAPSKDVDGLGKNPEFEPATPLAVMWLLTAYNINLNGKNIVLVGKGKLVGAPLNQMLIKSGLEPIVVDKNTKDLKSVVSEADIIVTATGVPGLITSDMIKQNAVVVDAGVASEGQKTVGDVDPEIYNERIDLTITPTKGGLGPMTVCALFDNVIQAADKTTKS
jgi:methylenetetrahydrofolate dehydrogenase (NADP+)/methenyltetrahydrofolate cyclohydrolase